MELEVETTRVSSKGQVVIPQAIREKVGLAEGDVLAVYGENGDVVLRRLELPKRDSMKAALEVARRYARRSGMTRKELAEAIREYRRSIQKR